MSEKVNMCYLIPWILVITFGSFQFGFGISYFNCFTVLIYKQFEHYGVNMVDDRDLFNSI